MKEFAGESRKQQVQQRGEAGFVPRREADNPWAIRALRRRNNRPWVRCMMSKETFEMPEQPTALSDSPFPRRFAPADSHADRGPNPGELLPFPPPPRHAAMVR